MLFVFGVVSLSTGFTTNSRRRWFAGCSSVPHESGFLASYVADWLLIVMMRMLTIIQRRLLFVHLMHAKRASKHNRHLLCRLFCVRWSARPACPRSETVFASVGPTIDSSNTTVLYFAMLPCIIGVSNLTPPFFLLQTATEAYSSTPLGSAWLVVNNPNLNARALTSGLCIAAGNGRGLPSSNVYCRREAPRYITCLRTNIVVSR